jgi:iron(III) transport system substrate-binding protein
MNKLFSFFICLTFAMAVSTGAWSSHARAAEITVYTSYEEDEAAAFLAAFNKDLKFHVNYSF